MRLDGRILLFVAVAGLLVCDPTVAAESSSAGRQTNPLTTSLAAEKPQALAAISTHQAISAIGQLNYPKIKLAGTKLIATAAKLQSIVGGWQLRVSSSTDFEVFAAPTSEGPELPPRSVLVGEQLRKRCPDCAETILADARVCKHCGYRFAPRVPPT